MADLQTADLAQILQSIGDKRDFMILSNFTKFGFFFLLLGASAK